MKNEITEWLLNTVEDESWKSYNSLHIDEICIDFKNKENWLQGGIKNLRQASSLLEELAIRDKKVFLLVPLIGKSKKIGINFSNSTELKSQLDSTPPSLYLYENDWSGYVDTINEGVLIDDTILDFEGIYSYHVEYVEEGDHEYRRSLIFLLRELVIILLLWIYTSWQ